MKAHIDAFKAALTAAGLRSYFADAGDSPEYPYVLLWTGEGTPPVEDAVAPVGDFEDTLGVTSVAGTADGVLILRPLVRAALASFADGSTVVPGRIVWLTLTDSRPAQVDRDVPITATNRHPSYGVDLYRLVSVPA